MPHSGQTTTTSWMLTQYVAGLHLTGIRPKYTWTLGQLYSLAGAGKIVPLLSLQWMPAMRRIPR